MKALVLKFACLVWVTVAPAQETAWDQQNLTDFSVFPGTYFMIPAASPVGQQFTPTLSALDTIGVAFGQNSDPTTFAPLQVFIHSGPDIFGPVVGSSRPIILGGTADGRSFVDFTFDTPVVLTPGQMYVLEVRHSGTDPYGLRYVPGNEYTGGNAVVFGTVVSADLVFREGLAVPESSVAAFFLFGFAALLFFRTR